MKQGRRFRMHGLSCVYLKTALGHGRIGFAVSRKYGNSVERHIFKRYWREAFRCHPVKLLALDVLIIPTSNSQKQLIQQNSKLVLDELVIKQRRQKG